MLPAPPARSGDDEEPSPWHVTEPAASNQSTPYQTHGKHPHLVDSLTNRGLSPEAAISFCKQSNGAMTAVDSGMLPSSDRLHSSLFLCKMLGCKVELQLGGRADLGGLSVVLVRMIMLSSKSLTKTPVSFTKLMLHIACPVNPHLRHPTHAFL